MGAVKENKKNSSGKMITEIKSFKTGFAAAKSHFVQKMIGKSIDASPLQRFK